MRIEIDSGGLRLAGHLYQPSDHRTVGAGRGASRGLVLCHGFPAGPGGSATSGQTFPEFAERLAADTGWTVLTFNFRGAGASEGDFSLSGWLTDLRAAIDFLLATGPGHGRVAGRVGHGRGHRHLRRGRGRPGAGRGRPRPPRRLPGLGRRPRGLPRAHPPHRGGP